MPAEARILEEAAADVVPPPLIACSRASPRIAASEADRLVSENAAGLLSFGLAGGLDPRLTPGVIIVAERIVAPDGAVMPCDPAWLRTIATHLSSAGIDIRVGAIAGNPVGVSGPEAKRDLARDTGALAVDMESHILAQRAKQVPLLALRAIADPAGRAVPPAAMAAMDGDGGYRPEKTIFALFRRPRDLPGVLELARDAKMGFASLSRVAATGAPFLPIP